MHPRRLSSSPVLLSRSFLSATAFGLLLAPSLAVAIPCVQPDAGGTVSLPPVGCGYLSPSQIHMIIDGLPPGTTIRIGAEHLGFFNISHLPGGTLGGEIEQFGSNLQLHLQGTGSLGGLNRLIGMQAMCETHTAPRIPGPPVQSFDTDMFRLDGQIPAGDPDFDLLRITAGTSFGMPSPGHTTLTQLPGGNWSVDSFFDVTYRIDFVGTPGGQLSGMSGSTTATIRMRTGEPQPLPPCTVVDNGTGTIDLPPAGCGYVSPTDLHRMIAGLPPGTSINVGAQHAGFNVTNHGPGGLLGGEFEQFGSSLQLHLSGTGELQGYQRNLSMQAACETHTGPRTPGQPVQSFDTDMFRIQGQLPPGDPDFTLFRITGGTQFGMPSPGHTTLTQLTTGGTWNVDSFFDISYRIEFIGRPGGPFAGMSGTTMGTVLMQTGQAPGGAVGAPEIGSVGIGEIALSNRPNPFDAGTTIEYRLPNTAEVRLEVYDVGGHLVRRLTNERMPAGPHAMFWDGRDDTGKKLGTGVYFIKISSGGEVLGTSKATILK